MCSCQQAFWNSPDGPPASAVPDPVPRSFAVGYPPPAIVKLRIFSVDKLNIFFGPMV